MKKLLLLLLTLPLLLSNKPIGEGDVEAKMFGVWRTIDNDFVQISRNSNFEITFMRISAKRQLMAKGFLDTTEDGNLEIERQYPKVETYTSDYKFSPSGKTLVIMKPDGVHAWLLERVSP